MYGGKGLCWPCFVSALSAFQFFSAKLTISLLPSHPILFCQAKYFCQGGAKVPPAPPPRNAYAHNYVKHLYIMPPLSGTQHRAPPPSSTEMYLERECDQLSGVLTTHTPADHKKGVDCKILCAQKVTHQFWYYLLS